MIITPASERPLETAAKKKMISAPVNPGELSKERTEEPCRRKLSLHRLYTWFTYPLSPVPNPLPPRPWRAGGAIKNKVEKIFLGARRTSRAMRRTLLTLLCVLVLSPLTALAQESPSARFTGFLATLSRATALSEIRPYFSSEGWNKAYGDLGEVPPEEQAEILKATSDDFKGWTVKSEKISGAKATLVVGPAQGETTNIELIQEGGAWVFDS